MYDVKFDPGWIWSSDGTDLSEKAGSESGSNLREKTRVDLQKKTDKKLNATVKKKKNLENNSDPDPTLENNPDTDPIKFLPKKSTFNFSLI